ncbi:MAG: aspartate aminotransferase family protein, partial [Lentisphaerae bacterium]|nr:aspartate aminotransferase family protein [Lentisphaerota bacterium]
MSTGEEIKDLYSKYVMPTYSQDLVLVRGKGSKVWDADGKVYLDFLAGISVLNVGHCHPAVVEAIRKQAGELVHVSNLYFNENQAKLAQKLSELSMGGKAFFCNSGAEANEGMIKLARLWGHEKGKYEIVCMRNSFHGRTLATAAATGQDKVKKGFDPMPEGFVYADLNDIQSVENAVTDKTVAVMVEAMQGEGGIIPADDDFMVALRELCDSREMLLLCDEVQCGMARTGDWFAFQASGVRPDVFSLAKALGSGYPIGAVVSSPELGDTFHPGNHASTFGGTPLACAASLATIEVIEQEGLLARGKQTGALFLEGLAGFVEAFEHVTGVRGRGLMLGMVLDQPAKPLVDSLQEMGLLCLATAENVVRFLPPLNVKESELEEALEMIHDCLAEWHGVTEDDDAEGDEEEAVEAAPEEPEPAEENRVILFKGGVDIKEVVNGLNKIGISNA